LSDPLPEHQIKALFEAARWAPICHRTRTTPEARLRSGEKKSALGRQLPAADVCSGTPPV
jgi:hypothetical protein